MAGFGIACLTGVRHFRVPDPEQISGGMLLASNHQSFLDPVLVGMVFREPIHFLARKTLFEVPAFGWMIDNLNAHPVVRESADTRALLTMLKVLRGGGKLLMFPEGTRTRDGSLAEFKTGAAAVALRVGVPVMPVCVEGAFEAWPRTRALPRPARIAVAFGELIDGAGDSAESLTNRVRGEVVRMQKRLRRIIDG